MQAFHPDLCQICLDLASVCIYNYICACLVFFLVMHCWFGCPCRPFTFCHCCTGLLSDLLLLLFTLLFFFFHELAAIVVLSLFIIAVALPGLLSHLLSLFISPLLNSSFLMNGLTLSSLHFLLLLHYNVFATPSYLLRLGTSLASLAEVQNRERSN